MCQRLVVVLDRGEEPAQDEIKAARFFSLEFSVADIGLVDDFGDGRQATVSKVQ